MLEAYFDDSGDPNRAQFSCCGGLIGSPEQWDQFVLLWSPTKHFLKEPFRSTDCETGHGQFENWDHGLRTDLMVDLVRIVRAVRLHSFASVVPVPEYRRVFESSKEHDPFFLAMTQVIMNAAFIALGLNDVVSLCFERSNYDPEIRRIFDLVQSANWAGAKHLAKLEFGTKQEYGLQAADMIAREAFKHRDNQGKGERESQ